MKLPDKNLLSLLDITLDNAKRSDSLDPSEYLHNTYFIGLSRHSPETLYLTRIY